VYYNKQNVETKHKCGNKLYLSKAYYSTNYLLCIELSNFSTILSLYYYYYYIYIIIIMAKGHKEIP